MNKILLISGVILFGFSGISQSTMQRITLVEQVTSASCGPCASQNPAFKTFVDNNYNDIVKVTYQRGGGSYIDPMWDFNPNEVDTRIVNFYNTTWFPNVWMNGIDYSAPSGISQGDLDAENAKPATFHIEATSQLINGNSEIQVDVTVTSLQDYLAGIDNQTRVYITVIEKDVNYTSAPGTNGEKNFFWVMRKMLPDHAGTAIGQQNIGEITTISETWAIDLNEVDPNDLDVVVWVQNGMNREVYQAYRTSMPPTVNPLSVEENVLSDVSVYPTVAQENVFVGFHVKNPSDMTIEIVDATGKRVKSIPSSEIGTGFNRLNISTAELANGIYFVKLMTSKDIVTKKLIISK